MPSAHKVQKRTSGNLEQYMQMVWATTWKVGTKPESFTRVTSALKC